MKYLLTLALIAIVAFAGYLYLTEVLPSTAQDAAQDITQAQTTPTQPTSQQPINTTTNQESMYATFKTNQGDIKLELFADKAPETVANFTKLAKEGFYDGVKFHRVIKGFMIQGGDPLSKDDTKEAMWGTGGPGYTFEDEIYEGNSNAVGTISMANAGPNTNGSQFFINVADNSFLNPKHTVFGKVVEGMEVVTAIENTETLPGDRPVAVQVIESIVLE